jgi:hypothetical protein
MSNYGRNFEFRIAPERGQRNGRYVNATGGELVLGTPIGGTGVIDELEREEIEAVTGATVPVPGRHGILIVEHTGVTGIQGRDPFLNGFSDADKALVNQQVMMVSGSEVKVVLRNTADRTFLNTRSYAGRVMVAGLGATPTLAVGDYLTPGTGDDDAGYWAEGTAANGWLVITNVDAARGEVEARLTF